MSNHIRSEKRIKQDAKKIKKETNCTQAEALDSAVQSINYPNYHAYQSALKKIQNDYHQTQSLIEDARRMAVNKLFGTTSFKKNWESSWRKSIESRLGNTPTPRKILDLGDNLGDIFRSTGVAGRAQNEVSAAGHTWEALVCWYLNLSLANSRVVVIKQNKMMIPDPIRHAITVKYGNFPSNTEADLIAITFPDDKVYTESIIKLSKQQDIVNAGIKTFRKNGTLDFKAVMNILCDKDFESFEVGIIQCKTNWNDNAQIPMLWDMIYNAQGFANQITVGNEGYSINSLKQFTYSFVTVPTVDLNKIKPESTQVKRVANLSGGNYWGYPTRNNVAQSIKEIVGRNYANGTSDNVLKKSLPLVVDNLTTQFKYFRIF